MKTKSTTKSSPPQREPKELEGRMVSFHMNPMKHRGRCGRHIALVRRVDIYKRTGAVRRIRVQMLGGDDWLDAKSLSAKCGGNLFWLTLGDIVGVYWHKKIRPLDEWMGEQA